MSVPLALFADVLRPLLAKGMEDAREADRQVAKMRSAKITPRDLPDKIRGETVTFVCFDELPPWPGVTEKQARRALNRRSP